MMTADWDERCGAACAAEAQLHCTDWFYGDPCCYCGDQVEGVVIADEMEEQ